MSKFGWDLPPGVTQRMIDDSAGTEGPMDCPICVDGVELDGPECPVDISHGVTCPKHGCVLCNDLEKQRVYCANCGDYLRRGQDGQLHIVIGKEGRRYCSEACKTYDTAPPDEYWGDWGQEV